MRGFTVSVDFFDTLCYNNIMLRPGYPAAFFIFPRNLRGFFFIRRDLCQYQAKICTVRVQPKMTNFIHNTMM